MAMYMPFCQLGETLTDLRNPALREIWASRQGECWDYRANGAAYWYYCQRCHMQNWPNDRRCNNGWMLSGAPAFRGTGVVNWAGLG